MSEIPPAVIEMKQKLTNELNRLTGDSHPIALFCMYINNEDGKTMSNCIAAGDMYAIAALLADYLIDNKPIRALVSAILARQLMEQIQQDFDEDRARDTADEIIDRITKH